MPPFPIHIPSPPTLFQTYLVPSLPFRRRQSSTSTTETTPTTSPSTSPPTVTGGPTYLSGSTSHLRCNRCLSDLASSTQIISKGFTGRHGRAYLVAPASDAPSSPSKPHYPGRIPDTLPNLPNTHTHRPVPRQLVTGAHTVGDISCAQCGSVLGWKYIAAEEEGQRYKVGKFILETKKVCRSSVWEEGEEGVGKGKVENARVKGLQADEAVEFDSQDEDECEDLFLGVWTPQLAARRRRARVIGRLDE